MREVNESCHPIIISVVGTQNAGKTTLGARMCQIWSEQGLHVAVIKHDGHADAQPDDWEKPGSDTAIYQANGAAFTMITGGGASLIRICKDARGTDIDAQCTRMMRWAAAEDQPLDVILVEGYKHSNLPKVVPIHRVEDIDWVRSFPKELILAVVAAESVIHLAPLEWAVYHESEVTKLCDDIRG